MKVDILGVTQHYPFDGSPSQNIVTFQLPSGAAFTLTAPEETIIQITREFVGVGSDAALGPPVMPTVLDTPFEMDSVAYNPMRIADEAPSGVTEAQYRIAETSRQVLLPPAQDPGEVPEGEDEEGVGSI
jgi:hypothetical protein